jgi:uncharacterized membrane protein
MPYRNLGCGLVFSFVTAIAIAAAPQGTWHVLTYPEPAPGVERTWCMDIGARGDMVGYRVVTGVGNRAFLLSAGVYYDLHPAGATSSFASGINARGDIVGDYWMGGQEHGMLISDGQLITIDLPGKAMAHLRGINSRGDIVGGYMVTNTSPLQGFLLQKDGTLVEVQPEGSTASLVLGINERGDMVGEFLDADGWHGFLLTKQGEFLQLDYPGAIETSAWRINASGEIVGYYWDGQTPSISHGFRWRKGEFVQDDYPGAVHTMNHGLNARGDTCGMMRFALGPPSVWGGFAHVK